jgi:lactoylglutathione lyase
VEHLGVRFEDESGLGAVRRRLEGLAIPFEDEPDTECCYARLARIWVTDPSGVRWELFVAREAVVEASSRAGNAASCCEPSCCATLDS